MGSAEDSTQQDGPRGRPAFADTTGRTWVIELNVSTVKRVEALTGVNVPRLTADHCRPLAELLGDVIKLADVLFALVKGEADRLGVTDEEFGRSLSGEVLERAADSLVRALCDFFPRQRVLLRSLIAKAEEVESLARDRVTDRLTALTADQILRSIGSPSVTASPASSASIPEG